MAPHPRIQSIEIQGYKPFRNFTALLQPLEIIVGSNGSGKSSLFEFLKFLTDSMENKIPNEIIKGSIGQQIFHFSRSEKFEWSLKIDTGETTISYQGELMGPRSNPQISWERIESSLPYLFMDIKGSEGRYGEPAYGETNRVFPNRDRLALSTMNDPVFATIYQLREYIAGWKFYSSFARRLKRASQRKCR